MIDKNLIAWDPMPCILQDGTHLLFCLSAPRTDNGWDSLPFWQCGHGLRMLSSPDGQAWEDHGEILQAPAGTRMCAGTALADGNTVALYLSYTSIQDGWNLDQRLSFHELSVNGLREHPILSPDSHAYFRTNLIRSDKMLYSCRDPYVVLDQNKDALHMWIVAGGRRWGVPPRIVYAISEYAGDPFEVRSVALDAPAWNGYPLNEIERVSVFQVGSEWWMTGHCWAGWVHPKIRDMMHGMGETVTDSTIWLFKSDHPEGPFEIQWDVPIIQGSSQSGLYGTHITKGPGRQLSGIGWRVATKTIDAGCRFQIDVDRQEMIIQKKADD